MPFCLLRIDYIRAEIASKNLMELREIRSRGAKQSYERKYKLADDLDISSFNRNDGHEAGLNLLCFYVE